MQFEFICPTNFSLSPDLDKLKLVGLRTASPPGSFLKAREWFIDSFDH